MARPKVLWSPQKPQANNFKLSSLSIVIFKKKLIIEPGD